MAKTQFLNYTIYLDDAALVATLQAAPHAGGAVGRLVVPPTQAAITYSAPIQEETTPMTAPCIRSEWFTTGNNFPRDQRTFQRCNGGWFGICFLFGTRINFYWRGEFKFAPKIDPTIAPTGGTKVAMALGRWADGAELPLSGENGSGNAGPRACRAASRHLQGYGYNLDGVDEERVHTFNESNAALPTTSGGWERLYIRVWRYPSAKTGFWKTSGSGGQGGIEVGMNSSGQLLITNIDAGGGQTLLATLATAVPIGVWVKLDCVYQYRNTVKSTGACFGLYRNGVNVWEALTAAPPAVAALPFGANGLGQDQLYASSKIGFDGTAGRSNNGICIQIDDWTGKEKPTGTSMTPSIAGTFPGLDWNHGTRIAMISAEAFAATNAASWAAAGDWRVIRQRAVLSAAAPPRLDNVTASARLAIVTDAGREIDNEHGILGLASMTVGMFGFEAGSLAGQLGYKLPGGAFVMAAVAQNNANYTWSNAWYQPSIIDPIHPCVGLELAYDHGAGGTAQHIQFLGASAELIGVFGNEDLVPGAPIDNKTPEPTLNAATQTAGYVSDVKALLQAQAVSLVGDCGAFNITKRVAWGLRDAGAGLQIKTSGANCGGKAVGIIMFPSGRAYDILGDAGGLNTPQWNSIADLAPALYAAPTDPGDAGNVTGPPEHKGIHNAPYPHSPWARRGSPPFSPVGIQTGTYVGNGATPGAFQDLTFRFPPHFLIIRAGSAIVMWWSSLMGGHRDGARSFLPMHPCDALRDPTFPVGAPVEDAQEQRWVVRIVGDDGGSNTNGTTYQYTAFCDPAMRFCNAGVLSIHSGATDIVNALDNEGFTPDAFFLHQEEAAAGTVGIYYRGIGHTADMISRLDQAEVAGALHAKGTITARAAVLFNTSFKQIGYLAFRKDDGSADAGIPRTIAITSYVGDGAGSRTIGMLMGGRRPVWALVVPHNGNAVLRDASHTAGNSYQFPNTNNFANGITGGGIDSISVGNTLNTNAVLYDVFVFPGDTVAGNNGWSQNGEFIPVAPDSPAGGLGLWDATPPDPELSPLEPTTGTAPGVNPVLPDGQTGTDFQTTCIGATTFVINQALAHIGVSKQIGDITTEKSTEATVARLHYLDDVSACLREFPWPFATRYARLVLVAGTSTVPVNGDWQYSYRAPADMMFARRLINPAGFKRGWDPNPPPFRLGSDDTGFLIYTDEAPDSGTLGTTTGLLPQLEYTIRTTCAALQGDSMFREALSWRHAASLAPSLARDDKKVAFCLQVYKSFIEPAKTKGAAENQQTHEGDVDWIAGRN